MKLSKQQQDVIHYQGSCTVLGVPGSGKTTVMFRKIAALIEAGTAPKDIAILVFSYRNLILLKQKLFQELGDVAAGIVVGTTVDLPLLIMRQNRDPKELPRVADNNFMRRLLRQAMTEVGFTGHTKEAEHIIRLFKSHGRKPSESEEHYDLFRAYKQHLEQTGLCDRHDIIRKHIIGMRNDLYEPVPVKHMFVDNFQDITQIQMLWLVDHLKAGKNVYAFGCDDLALFQRDGALGGAAFGDFEDMNTLKRFTFTKSYRLRQEVALGCEKIVSPLNDRLLHKITTHQEGGDFKVKGFKNVEKELENIAALVAKYLKVKGSRIGILTRHDLQARQVERVLQKRGIPHTSFARSIWETPGATLVLDLLGIFLNQTSKSRLRNVLSVFGVSGQAIETLYAHGLSPDDWLKRGAPIPKGAETDLPVAALRELGIVCQKLVNYARMIKPLGPKVVFKAMVLHMIEKMRQENQQDALLALDELLATSGNLQQVIKTLTEHRKPDSKARVIVAPVRESRNMEFTHTIAPFVTKHNYPYQYKVLPIHEANERRLLCMAASRASQNVVLTYSEPNPSPYLKPFI